MTLLVTGATGFVMSVLARHWVDADSWRAIVSLLHAPRLRYSAYNIAAGTTATLGELMQWTAERRANV